MNKEKLTIFHKFVLGNVSNVCAIWWFREKLKTAE